MSAALGMLLKTLDPSVTIDVFERLDVAAAESSEAWNNAGTRPFGLLRAELYAAARRWLDRRIKAISIAESFEVSKQFWAYPIRQRVIQSPETFIARIPHISFVWGDDNVEYLRKRYAALQGARCFRVWSTPRTARRSRAGYRW